MFEITLVRLSETSDYLLGQVNNPLAVIRRTSEKLQPDFICHCNAVIKLEEFMSWQCPGSDCHKVTTGFSNAFEVDTSRATMVPRSGGGGAVSRYYVITTVCQLGHWQNLAQPFDVFSVLGSNIIARKPYQGNHWLRQNLLAFKCSSMLTITKVWLEKNRLPCIQTMCYWSVELEKRGNITKT